MALALAACGSSSSTSTSSTTTITFTSWEIADPASQAQLLTLVKEFESQNRDQGQPGGHPIRQLRAATDHLDRCGSGSRRYGDVRPVGCTVRSIAALADLDSYVTPQVKQDTQAISDGRSGRQALWSRQHARLLGNVRQQDGLSSESRPRSQHCPRTTWSELENVRSAVVNSAGSAASRLQVHKSPLSGLGGSPFWPPMAGQSSMPAASAL